MKLKSLYKIKDSVIIKSNEWSGHLFNINEKVIIHSISNYELENICRIVYKCKNKTSDILWFVDERDVKDSLKTVLKKL